MDSVTVLLHRLGVAYVAIMNPVFRVRRDPGGELRELAPAADPAAPADGVERDLDPRPAVAVDERRRGRRGERRCCPTCSPMRGRWRSTPARSMRRWCGLANALDADAGRFPELRPPRRRRTAALARRRALRAARLPAVCGAATVRPAVDPASKLGVMRLRTDVLPQLTGPDDLLVLAQATLPSFLRYGAYPYVVVVRESQRRSSASSTGSSACSPSPR